MIHEQIKNQIKDAMRAKDAIRLEVLRGVSALFSNDLIAKQVKGEVPTSVTLLDDENALNLIRRSVKQRKDSIEQFEKGGRPELAEKERSELVILETFLPQQMSKEEIQKFVETKIAGQTIDKTKLGQFIGQIMKDLKGKADGSLVKSVVESLVS